MAGQQISNGATNDGLKRDNMNSNGLNQNFTSPFHSDFLEMLNLFNSKIRCFKKSNYTYYRIGQR